MSGLALRKRCVAWFERNAVDIGRSLGWCGAALTGTPPIWYTEDEAAGDQVTAQAAPGASEK